jgi:hypothetical protein
MLTLHSGRASRVVQLAGLNELGESIRVLQVVIGFVSELLQIYPTHHLLELHLLSMAGSNE